MEPSTLAWTYWFVGGTLVSFALAALTMIDNTSERRHLFAVAVLVLALGAMFGMSACIISQKAF